MIRLTARAVEAIYVNSLVLSYANTSEDKIKSNAINRTMTSLKFILKLRTLKQVIQLFL